MVRPGDAREETMRENRGCAKFPWLGGSRLDDGSNLCARSAKEIVCPGVAHPAALQEEQDNDVIDRRHVFLGQASSAVSKAGRRSVWLGRQGRVTAPEPCQSMKVYQ